MTKVFALVPKPGRRRAVGAYPRPSATEELEREIRACGELWSALNSASGSSNLDMVRETIQRARDFVSADGIGKLKAQLEAVEGQATIEEIVSQLGVLVGCFPNAGKQDLELYGAALVQDVCNRCPSSVALDSACRHLRRESKFVPTISEVLAELDRAETRFATALQIPESFEILLERAEHHLAQEMEWRACQQDRAAARAQAEEQAKRERDVRLCKRLISDGIMPTPQWPPDILADARVALLQELESGQFEEDGLRSDHLSEVTGEQRTTTL